MSDETDSLELLPLLKRVSRAFYLSIRVLPEPVRRPVGLAYLLARAADTIADTAAVPPDVPKPPRITATKCRFIARHMM